MQRAKTPDAKQMSNESTQSRTVTGCAVCGALLKEDSCDDTLVAYISSQAFLSKSSLVATRCRVDWELSIGLTCFMARNRESPSPKKKAAKKPQKLSTRYRRPLPQHHETHTSYRPEDPEVSRSA